MDRFDATERASIASALRGGEYNLLLGSGVSLDSTNGRGEQLPTAEELRLDLCALKGANQRSPLQRVYASLTDAERAEYVVDRFRSSSAGPTLQKLSTFLWNRIFTFNIDDALEDAYWSAAALQEIATYNFDDDYIEKQDATLLQIIHLHGWVRRLDSGFVFSRDEYVRQIRSINPWMVVLTQFIPVEPFIIAGTSLDEVDLDYYLAFRSQHTARRDRAPSFLVEPYPDAIIQRECDRYNLTLFKGTMEEFLDYWNDVTPNRPRPVDLVPAHTRELFPAGTSERTVSAFAADFEVVPRAVVQSADDTNFLYGHPPSWQDIAANVDVPRNNTRAIEIEVSNRFGLTDNDPHVVLMLDGPGSGKTAVLKRVSYDIASSGAIHVLTCTALSRIEPESTATALDMLNGAVVLVVDNLADQARQIVDTLLRLTKKDVVVIAADRDYRRNYIGQALNEVSYKIVSRLRLTEDQAGQLIQRYAERGLLGAPELAKRRYHNREFRESLTSDPIAVAACRIMNDFHPLNRIVDSVIAASSRHDLQRYVIAALAQYCFRGGVRYDVLSVITGREGWDKQVDVAHPLPLTFYDSKRRFIIPLNAVIAERVLKAVSPETVLGAFIDLANAIASRVNRVSIRERTPEARLAARLFDYDQVTVHFLNEKAHLFYEATREQWRWNSRYWEQVALLELARYTAAPGSSIGEQAMRKAVQHARHAVSVEHHPLTLTTLGKVLLSQMEIDPESAQALYDEAHQSLVMAIRLERERLRANVQPFVTLFKGTRTYIEHGGMLTALQADAVQSLLRDAQGRFRHDPSVLDAIYDVAPLLT